MENTWDIIRFVVEMLAVIIGGGWLVRVLTIKPRVKKEAAEAAKEEALAKAEQIENIRKIVDEIYEPAFKNLNRTVSELRAEIDQVRDEKAKLRKELSEMKEEYGKLKEDYGKLKEDYEKLAAENESLRSAVRRINPDAIPSKRSENAKGQPRSGNGQFTKREG